jgi:hypothetical protein
MRTVMNRENFAAEGEAARSLFTPIEGSRIEHAAVHAAATRVGIITIRGWAMQPKTSVEEPRRSAMVEGLLWQISEEMTRRAQVMSYRERGLTKREIIRAVWKVEEGPLYESACAAYEEIVGSQRKKI